MKNVVKKLSIVLIIVMLILLAGTKSLAEELIIPPAESVINTFDSFEHKYMHFKETLSGVIIILVNPILIILNFILRIVFKNKITKRKNLYLFNPLICLGIFIVFLIMLNIIGMPVLTYDVLSYIASLITISQVIIFIDIICMFKNSMKKRKINDI